MIVFPISVLREPGLHKYRVHDGQRRGRHRDPRDLGLTQVPACHEVREQPGADEREHEREPADEHGLLELPPQERRVDLRAGQEREHDAGERCEEVDPRRRGHTEGVPGDDPERDLDDRDRETDLDAHHRGDEDGEADDRRDEQLVHVTLRQNVVW